jgi:hypothetical protein
LISGQPLYLLYSNSKSFVAVPALMLAAFAVQATGSVRLQVTGNPPTANGRRPPLSGAQPYRLNGNAAAIAPCSSCRRPRRIELKRESLAERRTGIKVRRSVAHEYIVFDYEHARQRTYNCRPLCHSFQPQKPTKTLTT